MFVDQPPILPALLPTHAIDTFGLPADRSREVWRAVVDGTFDLEGHVGAVPGHRVRTQVWFLEDLVLARFEGEANVVHRTRALVDRNPSPVVKVRVYRYGQSILVDGDTQTRIGTGAIHFIDHDRPRRQVSSDHDQFTISVPYHAIGYDPSVHPGSFSIGLDTARGRMVEAGLSALVRELGAVSPAEAPALSAAIVGLLRGTLAGSFDTADDNAFRQARIGAFKRYIDQHLADPDLGMTSLLREFGASRATIYRDFAEHGGLQSYILERRLLRAYRVLAELPPVRGRVQDVASRCGFASLPHFSRRFRATFGGAPSDVVGQWSQTDALPHQGSAAASSGATDGSAVISALQWGYKRFR